MEFDSGFCATQILQVSSQVAPHFPYYSSLLINKPDLEQSEVCFTS